LVFFSSFAASFSWCERYSFISIRWFSSMSNFDVHKNIMRSLIVSGFREPQQLKSLSTPAPVASRTLLHWLHMWHDVWFPSLHISNLSKVLPAITSAPSIQIYLLLPSKSVFSHHSINASLDKSVQRTYPFILVGPTRRRVSGIEGGGRRWGRINTESEAE
jgi:hypothetical protein